MDEDEEPIEELSWDHFSREAILRVMRCLHIALEGSKENQGRSQPNDDNSI